jgi:type III pantothenate kinase
MMIFPFVNGYETPKLWELTGFAAGQLCSSEQNRLVIDAGHVSFDFVNENDKYLGGAIAPGLQLRYKSYMMILQPSCLCCHYKVLKV